jgi:hypothetical protein
MGAFTPSTSRYGLHRPLRIWPIFSAIVHKITIVPEPKESLIDPLVRTHKIRGWEFVMVP